MILYATSSISFACVGMKDSPDVDVVTATATAIFKIQVTSNGRPPSSICECVVLPGELPNAVIQ